MYLQVAPARKWRYFYVDGLFAAATHYIIKSNESDEFNMEALGKQAFHEPSMNLP